MSESQEWTVGRLLTWTKDYLDRQQAENPRLDAEVLLAAARGCERIQLYTAYEEVVDEQIRGAFRELVKRRAAGEPVAYLVGHREFYSLSFRVSRDVLIPRPETEFVVIALLDLAKEMQGDKPIAVADVGAGSGVIGISAAVHEPRLRVTAIDISPAALAIARHNAADHEIAERMEFVESDLFAALPAERTFDFVVSNPPYIAESELAEMSPTVKDYEPRLALVAGPSGLEIFTRLVDEAAARLNPGGWLISELSPTIATAASDLLQRDERYGAPQFIKDLAGLPRVVQAQRVH